jgi:hypothetical protein
MLISNSVAGTAMVTLLITSVVILGLIVIAVYFWQKPASKPAPVELPPRAPASLFAEEQPQQITAAEESSVAAATQPYEDERQAKIAAAAEFIESWQQRPDRISTAKMLHLAAASDDAETYNNAAELALDLWRDGRLADVSAAELQSLLVSEFWLLSSATRSSGAGFVLKRTLSRAKRELETVNNLT